MKVLTLENESFDLDTIPDEIDDIHFWVLEYSNTKEDTDYYSKPLLFLDIFNDIRLDIMVGDKHIYIPRSWSILCADRYHGDAELLTPTMPGFNERGFSAFEFNPITGFKPEYNSIEILSALPETRWHMPKLKYGQLLAVPLTNDTNPQCVYITHQKNNKVPEVLNIEYLF